MRAFMSAISGPSSAPPGRTVSGTVVSPKGNPYPALCPPPSPPRGGAGVREARPMDLKAYIRDIPDFPRPGILFKDITPLLAEPRAFQHAIDRLDDHYRGQAIDAVAAAE